jgi:hypothetical protein
MHGTKNCNYVNIGYNPREVRHCRRRLWTRRPGRLNIKTSYLGYAAGPDAPALTRKRPAQRDEDAERGHTILLMAAPILLDKSNSCARISIRLERTLSG